VNTLFLLRISTFLAVLFVGWLASPITIPLVAAWLLMTLCLPWKERWRGRLGDLGATLACLTGILLLPLFFLAPVAFDLAEFRSLLPDEASLETYQSSLHQSIGGLVAHLPAPLAEPLQDLDTQKLLLPLAEQIASVTGNLLNIIGGFFGLFTALLLLPVFLFFLLQGAPWLPKLRKEIPFAWQATFDRTLPKIRQQLAEYCRARLLVALAKGLIAGSVLFLFQTPAAYTLGLVVGAASLLPVVGPLLGLAFLLIVAFPFHGPLGLALAGFLYLGTEILEGYVLLPRLVGRRLGLDDFAVILTVLVGGALLGIFGMLIAIPALVVVRVIYQEILRPALHATD